MTVDRDVTVRFFEARQERRRDARFAGVAVGDHRARRDGRSAEAGRERRRDVRGGEDWDLTRREAVPVDYLSCCVHHLAIGSIDVAATRMSLSGGSASLAPSKVANRAASSTMTSSGSPP